jgi:hypothetical protein
MTLDTRVFTTRRELECGVYYCTYPGRIPVRDNRLNVGNIARLLSNAPQEGRPIRVLLMDVATYLQQHISACQPSLQEALAKATHNSEWLILPLDPSEGAAGELTAMLDDACITTFERYRREAA